MPDVVPIDPQRPVAGNLAGTFSGFIAMLIAGYIGKLGLFTIASHFFSNDPAMCTQLESGLFVFTIAIVGSLVNYTVTHFSQIAKLKALYDAMPSTYADYSATGMPPTQDPKRRS